MEPNAHPLFFVSPACPDFSTAGNPDRPPSADSQVGRILKAMASGVRITTMSARQISGSENAKARISEARKWVKAQGLQWQQQKVVTANGAHIEAHWLEPLDAVAVWERMKQKG